MQAIYTSSRAIQRHAFAIEWMECSRSPGRFLAGCTKTWSCGSKSWPGWTFPKALRAILRQDPDVILVGEIRDADTALTAFHAAMTGHLVMSSLHATDAISALLRLTELGVDRPVLSSALIGIVAQRLV